MLTNKVKYRIILQEIKKVNLNYSHMIIDNIYFLLLQLIEFGDASPRTDKDRLATA